MSTHKMRIHVTVPDGMDRVLLKLAQRDGNSLSSKVVELMRHALETEEDAALIDIASSRENKVKKTKYLSHEKIWK